MIEITEWDGGRGLTIVDLEYRKVMHIHGRDVSEWKDDLALQVNVLGRRDVTALVRNHEKWKNKMRSIGQQVGLEE